MISFLRHMVARFLERNSKIVVNGLSLEAAVRNEFLAMDEFVRNVVLPPRTDARLIVIAVTPLVLRISLDCVVVDLQDRDTADKLVVETFSARAAGLDHTRGDGLDLHAETLAVMMGPGHYDILYPRVVVQGTVGTVLSSYDLDLNRPKVESKVETGKKSEVEYLDRDSEQEETKSRTTARETTSEQKGFVSHCELAKKREGRPGEEQEWVFVPDAKASEDRLRLQESYVLQSLLPCNIVSSAGELRFRCSECKTEHLELKDLSEILDTETVAEIARLRREHSDVKETLNALLKFGEKKKSIGSGTQQCGKCKGKLDPAGIFSFPAALYRYNEGLVPFWCSSCKTVVEYDKVVQLFNETAVRYLLLHYCAGCGTLVTNRPMLLLVCNHLLCDMCEVNGNPCKLCTYVDKTRVGCLECGGLFARISTSTQNCTADHGHRVCIECRKKVAGKCKACSRLSFKEIFSSINMKIRYIMSKVAN